MRKEIILIGIILLSINNVHGFVNGNFETGDFTGWDHNTHTGTCWCVILEDPVHVNGCCGGRLYESNLPATGCSYLCQDVDLSGIDTIKFMSSLSTDATNQHGTVYIDGNNVFSIPATGWKINNEIDVSSYSGIKTFCVKYTRVSGTGYTLAVDDFSLFTESPMVYNFKDECDNLLKTGYTDIDIDNIDSGYIYGYNSNPVSFHDDYFNETDNLTITSTTHYSIMNWYNKNPSYGGSEDLEVDVDWNLEVTVRNSSDNTIIPNAEVDLNFGCRCDGSSSTEIKYTDSYGKASFSDLANQNIGYTLARAGYTTVSSTIGVDFSPQAANYVTTLYMTPVVSGDPDPPDPDPNPSDPISVFFTNMSNLVMTQFNRDEISNFKLWYRNDDNSTSMLKFQYYNVSVYEDITEWNINANEYDYKTIPIANISNTGTYRGILYSDTSTDQTITVIDNTLYFNITYNTYDNETKEALNGTYITTDGGSIIDDTINTGTDNIAIYYGLEDLITYSYYAWKTGYTTTGTDSITLSGSDVSIDIYLDPVEILYSFTIDVYNSTGHPLIYSTIYLNGTGSLSTGANNFATFTDLSAGDYEYKASKSGYITSGWANTTITTADISETVYLNATTFLSDITIQNDGRIGKVNESTDHEIDIYIDSEADINYNVTARFYLGGSEEINISLTKINFTDNHYIWYPDIYHYLDGSTYYAKLYNETEFLLAEDSILCDDPQISTYNFTIYVFDEGGTPLIGATGYIIGEGSSGCGQDYYCNFSNLPPAEYTYYVTKTGYTDSDYTMLTIIDQDLSTNVYLVLYTEPETYNVTINVFNETGELSLTNSRVYLSGENSIDTGSNNYGIFTNISMGSYQYKASKSGYTASDLITLNVDSDKSVNVNLILSEEIEGYTTTKMTDTEIKNTYLPLMWLLFFAIVLGAIMTLINGDW